MTDSLVTLSLLALAASFLPLQFGFETSLMGKDKGLRNGAFFTFGINLFRIVLVVGLALVFAGSLELAGSVLADSSANLRNSIQEFRADVAAGDHVVFSGLLILAGLALWFQLYRQRRNPAKDDQPVENEGPAEGEGKGPLGLLLLGFAWTAISINQWLFMAAAIGQISSLSKAPTYRLLFFVLFLIGASLMLLLPILFHLLSPERARVMMDRMNQWLNRAMPAVLAVILGFMGLYFILRGALGVYHFVTG